MMSKEAMEARLTNPDPETLELVENFKAAIERSKLDMERDYQARNQRTQILDEQLSTTGEATRRYVQQIVAERETQLVKAQIKKYTTADFDSVLVLGQGSYGVVHLVQRKGTDPPEFYALKQMRKSSYHRKNTRERAFAEREILGVQGRSRWFVELFATFQDADHVYMAMEFVQGGDLFKHLEIKQRFTIAEARFYMAELLLALEVVHNCGFLHRDIKADNIILTSSGHLKLLDFGLCRADPNKKEIEKLNFDPTSPVKAVGHQRKRMSLAGTPMYMAPETFDGYYSGASDVWAAAIVFFECLYGSVPFYSGDLDGDDMFSRVEGIIRSRRDEILRTKYQRGADRGWFTPEAKNLLQNLLCDEEHRLSIQQCKEHVFFSGVNFDTIHLETAPILPAVNGPGDYSNFDTSRRRELPEVDESFLAVDPYMEWSHYEFNKESRDLQRPSVFKDFVASVIESATKVAEEGRLPSTA